MLRCHDCYIKYLEDKRTVVYELYLGYLLTMVKLGVVFVISATKGNNETKGVLGGE